MKIKNKKNKGKERLENFGVKRNAVLRNIQLKRIFMFLFLLFFVIIFLTSLTTAVYSRTNTYTPLDQFLGGGFLGGSGTPGQFDRSLCEAGQDFVVQVAPFGCTPAVIRSDLLEEQEVPVFCQLAGTKINPLIDVKFIDYIDITGDKPKEVSRIGYMPAQAALGRRDGKLENVFMENLGYAVIVLKKQPNESAMPDYVQGNLTARIRYDVENAFGVGKASFYLPLISNENEWQNKFKLYGFWEGKGYLRAEAIDKNSATISLYGGAGYFETPRKIATEDLEKGKTSRQIPMPEFDYCFANLELKLDDIVNPDTRARLTVNSDVIEAGEGETFLDGRCTVLDITQYGITEKVRVRCKEDKNTGFFSSNAFILRNNPKITLEITDPVSKAIVKKDVGLGDFVGTSTDNRAIYLGYIGSRDNSKKPESLQVYFVKSQIVKEKLTDEEIDAVSSRFGEKFEKSESPNNVLAFFSNIIRGAAGEISQIVYEIVSENGLEFLKYSEGKDDVFGVEMKILGFAGPVDAELDNFGKDVKENYENAIKDYDAIIKSFASEQSQENKNLRLGEEAFIKKIILADDLQQKKTMMEFCNEFRQAYPNSNSPVLSKCIDEVRLANQQSSAKYVEINGKTKRIEFEGVNKPSYEEYSVKGIATNKKTGQKIDFELRKNEIIYLNESGGKISSPTSPVEYIQLEEIKDENTAVLIVKTSDLNFAQTGRNTLTKGTLKVLGNYEVSITQINLKKVAKVSVNPRIDYAGTEAKFGFRIGIEKRDFTLTPEKTQERIKSLDEQIKKWNDISNKLGTAVSGLKKACLATTALFTVENFFSNLGGEGIARTKVMRDPGGWYDKCDEMLRTGEGNYASKHDCLVENSDKIDADVKRYLNVLSNQDKLIGNLEEQSLARSSGLFSSDQVDVDALVEKYSPVVQNDISSITSLVGNDFKNPRKPSESINLEEIKRELDPVLWKEKRNYNFAELRDIGFYSNILKSNPDDEAAKTRLYSLLSNLHENSKPYLSVQNIATTLKISPNKFTFVKIGENAKEYPYTGLTYKDLGGEGNTPIAIVPTSRGDQYIVELDDSLGAKELPIKRNSEGKYLVYDLKTNALVPDDKLPPEFKGGIFFKKYDAGSYSNPYSNPEVKYYETPPYKGYPAIVPFNIEKGWYAAMKQTLPILGNLRSYDESGRLASYYLCNVGSDGKEEFFSERKDDSCHQINLNDRRTYSEIYGLSSSEISKLVNEAVLAIESAQRAYKSGAKQVTISGKVYKVGIPAVDIPEVECEDFMSPKQCQIMFNVCDPVICPSSRCDLGGEYPVRDVVQSGLLGSTLLCLPNIQEGIVVPVCLTGIQAGIDGWNSVLTSYRDCLQENLNTGRTIGICDEINSVYTCEFIWRQGLPIAKVVVPKLLSSALGQGTRGGGEYLTAQDAFRKAENSVDYFTQYYAEDSFKAFKARSLEEAGTPICKSFISAVYPTGDFINKLTQPDSPPQFHGRFDEIPFTTQTNPPISQYKVFYHVFAGKDAGAYYRVYLRGIPGSSYYQDTSVNRIVASGYIPRGQYATDTKDFTAPSGYSEMCIIVNDQQECGFKQVSTDFAVNYINDRYIAEQANVSDITTESECISGTPSLYIFLNPNAQSAANSLIDQELSKKGIVRVCATNNPGKGTDPNFGREGQRWVEVGYCNDKTIKCWIDRQTVSDVIKVSSVENETLKDLDEKVRERLAGKDYNERFTKEIEKISEEKDYKIKISMINSIFNDFFFNEQKGYLLLIRGNAFAELARAFFNPKINEQLKTQEEDKVLTEENKSLTDEDKALTETEEEISKIEETSGTSSPTFTFSYGGFLGIGKSKIYYDYSGNTWYWSLDKKKWFGSGVAAFSGQQTGTGETRVEIAPRLSNEIKDLTLSLSNKNLQEGIWALVEATTKNIGSGFGSNSVLSSDGVEFSRTGIFTVNKGTIPLYFEYVINPGFWRWSSDSTTTKAWNSVEDEIPNSISIKVGGGPFGGGRIEQKQLGNFNIKLISDLRDRNNFDGAAIIFGIDVPNYPSTSAGSGSGATSDKEIELPIGIKIVTSQSSSPNLIYNWDGTGWSGEINSRTIGWEEGVASIGEKVSDLERSNNFERLELICGNKQETIVRKTELYNKNVVPLSIKQKAFELCGYKLESSSTTTTLKCTTQVECQRVLGAEIIKKAREKKTKEGIKDEDIKSQTGAKNFECLVLQQAYQETKIQHCKEFQKNKDPLYCNGDKKEIIGGDNGQSIGIMQIYAPLHGEKLLFEENVVFGIDYLISGWNSKERQFTCTGKKYSGWLRALRNYNGWGCTGDNNYVEKVLNNKDEIESLFPETCK